MKKTLLLLQLLICSLFGLAQNELLIQNNDKGLHLVHTVNAKENFYSIGRLYNVSPKEIASFNNLDMDNGLAIGQVLQIPLTGGNFAQNATNGRPVYYVVGDKEGLYRVSLKNNKVLMANLRQWNNLSSDNIASGQKLIVGYLVSPEAANIVVTRPASGTPTASNASNNDSSNGNAAVEERKVPDTATPRNEPREERNNTRTEPAQPEKPVAVSDGQGGYFKSHYEQQAKSNGAGKNETMTSGIFKTAAGWQDTKYYALMDGVEPGTIIRVINPTNNKAIYAKVLGQMSGIRQNQGLEVRISNAAASILEIGDTEKFIVRVNY